MVTEPVKFRISGRMAELLGEQSVSDVIVAVTELVKNGYDADAKKVEVTFNQIGDKTQLIIKDDGHGMNVNTIKNAWLVIGTSNKVSEKISPNGRRKVGEKGIGRFAIQRLGDKIEVISNYVHVDENLENSTATPLPNSSTEQNDQDRSTICTLKIDWAKYRVPDTTFDQVENLLTIDDNPKCISGTTLIIDDLRETWLKEEVELLASQLKLIVPPSWDEDEFSIVVSAPYLGIKSTKITSGLLEHAAYQIFCTYTENGSLEYTIKLGKTASETVIVDEGKFELGKLNCGPLKFSFYHFALGPGPDNKLSRYVLKDSALLNQLKSNHGIKIFRDGFRVKPYGEPGNDWLGLNQMIVARRGAAFANNTVIGTVEITADDNPNLADTTTREGLLKNTAFYDLKELLKYCLRILVKQRIKDYKDDIPELYESPSIQKIERAVNRISKTAPNSRDKEIIEKSLKEFKEGVKEAEEHIIDTINMYRGLSSLGISVAAIAHEIGESIGAILQRSKYMLEVLKERPLSFKENLELTNNTWRDINKIREFISFAAVFTSAEERRKSNIDIGSAIRIVLDAYESILRDNFIRIETNVEPNITSIIGYRVDFEALMINLMTNAIESLRNQDNERKIIITCKDEGDHLMLKFSDSGGGIPTQNREIIFEPFWTNKDEGTGLGLAIIKEIVESYNGHISAIGGEVDHGATFVITIPKAGNV